MKILFAIKAINETKGGAERVLADVTAGLAKRGHSISLLTFDDISNNTFYPLSTDIQRIALNAGDTSRPSTFFESIPRMKMIRDVVKRERPDVFVCFMHSMFIPAAIACIGLGIPVVASEHIVPEHYKTRKMEFFFFVLASFFITRFTVLSSLIRSAYPRFLQKKMVVMPNPVKLASLQADAGADPAPNPNIILNVGRLEKQKDQETLIRAFATLVNEFPDWQVSIIGEGVLRSPLQKLIDDLGLDSKVFLKGSTTEIDRAYSAAKIFALPSEYESFGLATAEAMSHGLPPIGFADCPGTNELIEDGHTGLLVKGPDRVKGFAEGLRALMASPSLRQDIGARAKAYVERFSTDLVIHKWEELLSDLKSDSRLIS